MTASELRYEWICACDTLEMAQDTGLSADAMALLERNCIDAYEAMQAAS